MEVRQRGGKNCEQWFRGFGGRRTKHLFWEDLWVGDLCLKKKFPQLYEISSLKHHAIGDCGFWDGVVRV